MTMCLRPKCVANPPATGVYVHDVCMTGQGERSKCMARRKSYQKGTVFTRGKKGNGLGVGRWWEYGLARDGAPRRVRRSRVYSHQRPSQTPFPFLPRLNTVPF